MLGLEVGTMRVALYVRCSTTRQDTDNQLRQLREWAEREGWTVTKVYEDYASGKTAARKQLQQLFTDAESKRFDLLCFWALDRLTREGPLAALLHLEKLTVCGVKVRSYTEQWLDTTTPMGELMIPIIAWVGKQERLRISQRVKAGLQRVRASGKRLGRKSITDPTRKRGAVDLAKVRSMRAAGLSIRAIAAFTGSSVGMVHALCSHKVSEIVPVSAALSIGS
jgi:DNA invertase Pin-like site-specific DNA recombinase